METANEIQLVDRSSWSITIVSLLPLWLFSLAIMVEGFPRSPIPLSLAIASFLSAIAIIVILWWNRNISLEFILYCGIPLWLLVTFDEIAVSYKNQYIITCTIILTIGAIGYLRSRARWLRWLFLVTGAALTFAAAGAINRSYWDLVSEGGYGACYPDCLPPADQASPWWMVLFNL